MLAALKRSLAWATVALVVTAGSAAGQPTPGLASTASTSDTACSVAQALIDGGQTAAATQTLIAALRREPSSTCAKDKLTDVAELGTPPDPCVVADALVDGGDRDGARSVLSDAIKKGGTQCRTPPVPLSDERKALSENVLGTSFKAVGTAAATALPWVLLAAVVFVAARLIGRRRTPQVLFEPFGEPSKDPKSGASLTALVVAQFRQPGPSTGPAPPPRMDVVESFSTGVDLPDLKAISPALEPVSALVRLGDWAARPPRTTVLGQVHTAGALGPGVTVRVARGTRLHDTTTLWTGSVVSPDEDDVLALSVPVGAWLRHVATTTADTQAGRQDAVYAAWMRAGALATQHGRWDRAVAAYDAALQARQGDVEAQIARALAVAAQATDPALEADLLIAAEGLLT